MRHIHMKLILLIISIIFTLPVIISAESITFTFNPPDSTRASVFSTENTTEIVMMEKSTRRRIDHSQELYLKSGSNFIISGKLLGTEEYENEVKLDTATLEFMLGMSMAYIIDLNGQLDSLDGYAECKDAILSGNRGGFTDYMPHYFDYEPFFIRISTDWQNQIGDFVGKTFEIGDTLYLADTVTNIEGIDVISKKVWFAETTDYEEIECVVIEYEYSIEKAYSEAYSDALRKSFADPELDYVDPDFEVLSDHTDVKGKQIMDPSTMLIYYSYEENTEIMQLRIYGGLKVAAQTYTIEEIKSEYEFKDD